MDNKTCGIFSVNGLTGVYLHPDENFEGIEWFRVS